MSDPEASPRKRRRTTFGDLFHERTNFQFIDRSWRWALLSGTFLLVSVVALAVSGLNLGIDFTGGLSYTVRVEGTAPTVQGVTSTLAAAGQHAPDVGVIPGTGGGLRSVRATIGPVSDTERQQLEHDLATAPPGFAVSTSDAFTVTGTGAAPSNGTVLATVRDAGVSGAHVSSTATPTGHTTVVLTPVLSSAERTAVEHAVAKYGTVSPGTSFLVGAEPHTPSVSDVRAVLAPIGQGDAQITLAVNHSTGVHSVQVQTPSVSSAQQAQIAKALARYGPESGVESVSPTWGSTVTSKATLALIVFFVLISIYLSARFEWRMALAAIIAVLHDILVTVGVYAITGFEVVPATVIAFLTILGFSLYDTVVVFDKVIENTPTVGTDQADTYSEMVNRSLNQVLMRSLNTTFVAVLPVASLVIVGSGIFGAAALKDFALALFVGLTTGAYSSIFVAAPILAWVKEREPRYRAVRERSEARARSRRAEPAPAPAPVAAAAPAAPGPSAGDGGRAADAPQPAPTPARPATPTAQPAAPRPGVGPGGVAPRPRQQRRRKRR